MNLLDKTADKNSKITAEILDILGNIQPENLKIAVNFFDFSKEMDLSLLDDVTFQDMSKESHYTSNRLWNHVDYKANDYTDRYLLFLDALGANTISNMLSYNFSLDIQHSFLKDILPHALSLKYNETDVKAKIVALAAEYVSDCTFRTTLANIAERNSEILLRAVDFCKGKYVNADTQLIATALYYTEPQSMPLEKEIAFLLDLAQKNTDNKDKDIRAFIMTACFMSYRHDVRLKNFCLNQPDDVLLLFVYNILYFHSVSREYLSQNIDVLMEILFQNNTPQNTRQFISECIIYLLKKFGVSKSRTEDIERIKSKVYPVFAKIAKTYPNEYINALQLLGVSDYEISIKNGYPILYDILKEVNPKAITEQGFNLKNNLIEKLISEEQRHCQPHFAEEVGQYLRGEIPLADLSDVFQDMHDNSYSIFYDVRALIEKCCKESSDFQRRYFAVKSIFGDSAISNLIWEPETMNNVIMALLTEKVPTEYRFKAYEDIYESFYIASSKEKIWSAILNVMVKLKNNRNEEYGDYYKKGTTFYRILYINYLDQTNDNDCNKALIFQLCTDSAAAVRRLAGLAIAKHKSYEPEVLELLKSKKAAVREVGIDILAQWGAKNYAEILTKLAENEKSNKLVDKIHTILGSTLETDTNDTDSLSPIHLVEQLTKGGRSRKLSWFYTENLNDKVHLLNGTEAGTKYMQALLLCYADTDTLGRSEPANLLAERLNQEELHRFAGDVFSAWLEDGASSKKKWVLYFCAIHGGSAMIDALLHYIKEWAENSRGAIAAEAVKALALNGTSEALMSIDNLAHKCKFKQVKNAAVQALENAADALGITRDELGDRIIPDLGFNQGMKRIFDYGTRQFKVYLTPTLELEVYDENDKKLKNLPAPSKKDNPEIAKKSNDDFKQMKKQLKSIVNIQKVRLETALLADRRWKVEAWTDLFVKNPIMHSFATGLIWAAYVEKELVQTFRYMEDGTFNTQDEDEYILPENCTIGLVHPIDLDEDTLNSWKEQLSDYEIIQPIAQLDRPVFLIKDEEKGKFVLERYNDKTVSSYKLLSFMTKAGWSKGSVQDAGCFGEFYREDITKRIKNENNTFLLGNAVSLKFSGMYVGYEAPEEEVTIEGVRFYKLGSVKRGSYVYDEPDDARSFKLETVKPRYFSEILAQLESLVKKTDEE